MAKDKTNFLLTPEQMLELITRKSLDAFIVSDTGNTVLVWTTYAETLFGWSAEEAVGEQLTNLIIPPEHRAAHEEGIKRFLKTGKLKNVNKRLELFGIHKHGHMLPLEMTVIPVELDGKILFTSSIRDNSERHQHQQMLQQQAALLQLSRDAIIVTDMQGRIEFWNNGAVSMFRYAEEDAIGRFYQDLLGTTCSPPVERLVALLQSSGYWDGEVNCRTRDGKPLSVLSRYAMETDHVGNPSRILISNTDISLQQKIRKHEALLVESEQRFNSLFEHLPDGVIHFNQARRLTSANDAFVRMSGYRQEEVLSVDRPYLVVPEYIDELIRAVDAALRGTPQTLETILLQKNASRLDVSVSLVPNVSNGQIIGVYGLVKDNSVHKKHERQIHQMATHDALTGLPNRYFLGDRLSHAIEQAKRSGGMVGVLFLDLNRFKLINDSLGHDKGDLLLGVVAERLKSAVREVDTVARLGGDEFVIVLENIHDQSDINTIAAHILGSIAKPVNVASHMLSVTTSIGSSFYPESGSDPAVLLRHADLAMYEAKAAGHGVHKAYQARMGSKASTRLLQESALRRAIDNSELVLHYQPRINLSTGTIACVEALVRWDHPDNGLLLPRDFIMLAEEIGLIEALGTWVIKAACQQLSAWHKAGQTSVTMSVNISAHQLRSEALYDTLIRVLHDAPFDASALELEITETAFMQDIEKACNTLNKIRALGIRLSIDDFGTGFSSLSQLKILPVDALKIDQSFMENLPADADNATMVSAMIAMGQKMNLAVVAEGVCHAEQLSFLKQNHCDEAQGYLFAYPCPATELEPFLLAHLKTPVSEFISKTD